MRRIMFTCFAVLAGFSGWSSPVNAGLFSATGPVIAIIADDLYQGEAEGHIGGSGTISIQSRSKADVTCIGQFTHSADAGGAGNILCSDGATATFQFQRLSLVRGHGSGISSRGPVSFTFGLSAKESEPYLKLPRGKAIRQDGKDLTLVNARQQAIATDRVVSGID